MHAGVVIVVVSVGDVIVEGIWCHCCYGRRCCRHWCCVVVFWFCVCWDCAIGVAVIIGAAVFVIGGIDVFGVVVNYGMRADMFCCCGSLGLSPRCCQ